MVESDRYLDEGLEKAPAAAPGGAPNVLQNLMGVEEPGLVKEGDPVLKGGGFHDSIVPRDFFQVEGQNL
jgi:hypothetical protein